MPSKTVYENVAFAMQVVETNPKYIRRNVPQILSMVGLGKRLRLIQISFPVVNSRE